MVTRQHLTVHGMVQGVGFRYRAKHMADALELTGTVRNLSDGTVELEVQGERSVIEEYLDRLSHSSYVQVTEIESYNMSLIS